MHTSPVAKTRNAPVCETSTCLLIVDYKYSMPWKVASGHAMCNYYLYVTLTDDKKNTIMCAEFLKGNPHYVTATQYNVPCSGTKLLQWGHEDSSFVIHVHK